MEAFNASDYLDALQHAITYGLMAICIMLVAGAVLTVASGGLAAQGWAKKAEQAH